MLTPLSWLKDYVDIDVTPKELEEKLFSCGFEVEESYEVGKDISNVVVGLVEKCEPIPETHLSLCQVNAGAHGTFQICCGADNVKAGGKYPLALIGATVYATAKDHVTIEGVMEIKQGKLRGYDSYGMLCSGVELGLNEDLYPGAGYNGLLVLPEDAQAGDDVKPILGLDDWILILQSQQTDLTVSVYMAWQERLLLFWEKSLRSLHLTILLMMLRRKISRYLSWHRTSALATQLTMCMM